MAKKKKRYPKRKSQIIKGSIIGLLVLAVIAAGVYGWSVLDKQSKSYVMTFDGEKISTDELLYYRNMLAMQGYGEYFDENYINSMAYDQLSRYLVIEKTAKQKGYTLTQEELTVASEDVEMLKSLFEMYGVTTTYTDEKLLEITSRNTFYDKLYNEATKDYVINNSAFVSELAERIQNGEANVDTRVKYVVTSNRADAEAAREKLLSDTPVDDVIKEYSKLYDENTAIEDSIAGDLPYGQEIIEELEYLNINDVTEVIELNETEFAVFKITQTEKSAEDVYRNTYNNEKKNAMFELEYEKWKAECIIEPNTKVYNPADSAE